MKEKDQITRMDIEGELSIFTAAAIRERLLDSLADGAEIEVDLSKVSEIDCAGVQLMVAAQREATARSKSLRFVSYSPAVLELLDLCGISGHFGDPVQFRAQA
ncbi:MAG: STAS domain-containing protein [Sulfuricella sp.]|nr:STAS domain-containing protein [Sulfuricella sp.]